MITEDSLPLHSRVEYERVRIVFGHAKGNMVNVLLGALLIAAVLFEGGTSPITIGIWLACITVSTLCSIQYEKRVERFGITVGNCIARARKKTLFAALVMMFYGIAVFLLPQPANPIHEMFLFIILSGAVTITTLSFAAMPSMYFMVSAVSMIPLAVHYGGEYLKQQNIFYLYMTLACVIWQTMVFQKAQCVSRTALEAVTLHQCLNDEIAAHEQAREALQHLAHNDALTNIGNRRYFEEVFQRTFHLAVRNHHKFGLLSLDLNDFKPVNDNHGHAVGDLLLKAVAERLVETVRATDFCARTGGDEFSVIVESVHSEEEVIDIAFKLQQKLAQPFDIQGLKIKIGASIGCAVYPEDGYTIDQLILVADKKMYHKKQAHKSGLFPKFEAEMSEP